jgi:FecR protein
MYKSGIIGLFIVLLVTLMLISASDALAQTPAGSVTSITGDVHIERAGTTVPATIGMGLIEHDRVVTAANSRVTITLTDNSKLELDESTSVVIDQQLVTSSSRSTKLSLFGGLVRSLVSHTAGTTNYQVYTPNAVASARGTQFDAGTGTQPPSGSSEEEKKKYKDCRRFSQISVYEGTVEVTNTTNPGAGSVQVPAGNKTLVVCGFAPLAPSPLGAAAATTAAATTAAATTAAATTAVTSSTALAVAGSTGIVGVAGGIAGGIAGGVAASTSSSGGSSSSTKKKSPKH